MQEQTALNEAAQIFHWNKRLMSTLGLWPAQRNNFLFSFTFGYFSSCMLLEYLDLCLFIGSLQHVVTNLTENIIFTQILARISTLWLYNEQLGELMIEAMTDFDVKKYKTTNEIKIFITYNARAKVLMKVLITFVALTASSYYFMPLLNIIGGQGLPRVGHDNTSELSYLLPYQFHIFYKIEDIQSYIAVYAIEFPVLFVGGFGHSATDCLMVTLVFHICGQMSVLATRTRNIKTESCECDEELRSVVKSHERLLQMGKIVDDVFSTTLLIHLVSSTSLLCVLDYQILINFNKGEATVLVPFVIYQFSVLLILYAHCTVGENFITESAKMCEAFYDCKWYDMSTSQARCIILCMARAQQPLGLSAGKFGTFCLSALTETVKTSVTYLSVLRSLM